MKISTVKGRKLRKIHVHSLNEFLPLCRFEMGPYNAKQIKSVYKPNSLDALNLVSPLRAGEIKTFTLSHKLLLVLLLVLKKAASKDSRVIKELTWV